MIPNIIPKKQTPFSLTPPLCDSAYNEAHNDPVIELTSQESVVEVQPKFKF